MLEEAIGQQHRSKRRSTGKLVVLNEEELIRQIALRPTLYDRNLKSYRKMALRMQSWNEVGEAMGASVEECRRRWRSLRDAFTKHYKRNSGTAGSEENSGGNAKRKKWTFYDQMSFMAPYLDQANIEIDFLDDFEDNSDDIILPSSHQDTQSPDPEQEEPANKENSRDLHDKVPNDLDESAVTMKPSDYLSLQGDGPLLDAPTTSLPNQLTREVGLQTSNDEKGGSSLSDELDSDEKFLLSCVPVLKRLSHRKNSLARLRIQQLLYDIEFGQP